MNWGLRLAKIYSGTPQRGRISLLSTFKWPGGEEATPPSMSSSWERPTVVAGKSSRKGPIKCFLRPNIQSLLEFSRVLSALGIFDSTVRNCSHQDWYLRSLGSFCTSQDDFLGDGHWGDEASNHKEFYEETTKFLVLQDGYSHGRIGVVWIPTYLQRTTSESVHQPAEHSRLSHLIFKDFWFSNTLVL